jgi:DHA3 family macrolide efflux protein-like MFS transporter
MEAIKAWRKPFIALYAGQAFSLLSSSAVQFAIIWWITLKTGSAISLTIASALGLLPQILIGPFAGVIIDRYKRKSIMIIADIGVALAGLALGIFFYFGEPSLALVYAILFLRALGDTFHKPALQAAIPQVVPEEELTRAGGLGQLVSALSSMAGPMFGALLVNLVPMRFVMLVDVGGALLAVLALSLVRLPDHAGQGALRRAFHKEMQEGFLAIRQNKALIRATIPVFLTSMVFMPLGSLLPLMVRQYFLGGPMYAGLAQTMFSIGMLVSALAIGIGGGSKRPFAMISLSSFLLGACSLIGGLLPPSGFWFFCVIVFLIGTTGMMGSIPYMAYIQKSVAAERLGKVIATVTSIISLGIPLGMLSAGPIAERVGVGNWMLGVGFVLMPIGAGSYLSTKRFDRRARLDKAGA